MSLSYIDLLLNLMQQEHKFKKLAELPSLLLWILAWIFFALGVFFFLVLILYTKYGRETSIKLSIITISMGSIFVGFSLHFLLLNFGI
ncbi:MAG: hypothetical protein ACTSYC_07190 [Promethearchaeota archaeon]